MYNVDKYSAIHFSILGQQCFLTDQNNTMFKASV